MTNPNKYLESINNCYQQKIPVYFSGNQVDTVFQTLVVELLKDCAILKNTIPFKALSKILSSETYYLQCELNQYGTNQIQSDGVNIVFPFEKIEIISETRVSDRISSYKKENIVEFINPYDKSTILKKPLLEYSLNGCSVKSHIDSKLFEAGTIFEKLTFRIDGQIYKNSGKVVYTKKILDLDGKTYKQVGLKFDDKIREGS